jgi:hypothetical protein
MLFRVYNQGEIPLLAHGWRSVLCLTPGRKWVTVIDWTTLETARLEIPAWERLNPQPDGGMSPRKVRAAMRRRLAYATPTQAIREALHSLREKGL